MKKLIFAFIALVLLVACSPKSTETAQIANPASVFCEEQNGTLEIRNTDEGQVGYCLKNEKECEEWAYYNGECSLE